MAMIVPVATVLVNLWLTPRGRTGRLWTDSGGRFVFVGTLWYLIACIQGPIQSLPERAGDHALHQLGGRPRPHRGAGLLGVHRPGRPVAHPAAGHAGGSFTRGGWSSLQFGLVMVGLVGFFVVLTMAGLTQGTAWHNGEAHYRVLPQISIYMVLRALAGHLHHLGRHRGLLQRGHDASAGPAAGTGGAGRRADAMKMTPALVVVGGLLGLLGLRRSSRSSCPRRSMRRAPSGRLAALETRRGGRPPPLRRERLQLLPFAVHPDRRLGPGRRADRPARRLLPATTPPSSAPSGPGPTSRRRAASTPTTGTSPTSPTRATRGRSRSCPRGSSWARRTIGH